MTAAIDGVLLFPLWRHEDERGFVMRMLRADDGHFETFGEIYFSGVHQGRSKGWRRHRRLTSFLTVPVGEMRLVLFDDRLDSSTRGAISVIDLSAARPELVRVPPNVWASWAARGSSLALLANCATAPHDPAEVDRLEPDDPRIPYDWSA